MVFQAQILFCYFDDNVNSFFLFSFFSAEVENCTTHGIYVLEENVIGYRQICDLVMYPNYKQLKPILSENQRKILKELV